MIYAYGDPSTAGYHGPDRGTKSFTLQTAAAPAPAKLSAPVAAEIETNAFYPPTTTTTSSSAQTEVPAVTSEAAPKPAAAPVPGSENYAYTVVW